MIQKKYSKKDYFLKIIYKIKYRIVATTLLKLCQMNQIVEVSRTDVHALEKFELWRNKKSIWRA